MQMMAITPLTQVSSNAVNRNTDSPVTDTELTKSNDPDQTASANSQDSATFSSRSERLAALNEEFNITGPGFELSSAFISRLQEFEFINASEAERLKGQAADTAEPAIKDAGPQAITELQQDLEALARTQTADGNLSRLLNDTAEALSDLKTSSPLANAPQYKGLQQRLEQSLSRDSETASLSDTDRYRMTQAMDVMLIASRLAPGSETNAGIRSYLANT
jgi:hypothetical protein